MGRMIDMMRGAERRPNVIPTPAAAAPEVEDEGPVAIVVAEDRPITAPPLEDDDAVPFIEVGGPRGEPNLRIVPAPAIAHERKLEVHPSPAQAGPGTREAGGPGARAAVLPLEPTAALAPVPSPASRERGESQTPALFTIRFQPVHAARLGGRGPIAELITFHQPDHPVSVQYRSLAAEIARQLPGPLPRVLLFTGAADGVGTSTVVLNLAITLARQETKVTVADAHLARPALAQRLGLPAGPGWREVIAGQMPAAWCLQETAQSNLLVLPAGVSGELRHGSDAGKVVEALRDRSDCVLLDAGPWGESESAADLAASSDAVYLVLWQDAAQSPEAAALQDEVLTQTGRLRGCVLTQK
jgi:Mrp family chromosome partitioning ATPase